MPSTIDQVERNAAGNANTARIIRNQLATIAGLAEVYPPSATPRTLQALLVAGDLLEAARERLAHAVTDAREAAQAAQASQQAAVETLAATIAKGG